MLVQELSVTDYENCKNHCQEMLLQISPTATFFSSDAAHFYLPGSVNKENFLYWDEHNSRQLLEKPLCSLKVTVWCAVFKFGLIGPYFLRKRTVTVNSTRYVSMLENYFQHRLKEMIEEHDLGDIWFQQDGATAHTAQNSLVVLRQMFPKRLVSKQGRRGLAGVLA